MAILPACVSSAAAPLAASVSVAECTQARTQVGAPGPSCSLASSFLGDKVRLKSTLAFACAGKGMQIVGAAQRDNCAGFQGEKPWDSQKALLSSIDNGFLSSREVNAVATEYPPTALFGNEDERDFEDGEVLHADNESVDDEDELAVANLGIPLAVVDALAKRGITQLFPIQRAVLDPAMQGRDIIARAKTGTGKTLAFGIPIINSVVTAMEKNRSARLSGRSPRALVLAPTRELAKQVEREFMESAPMLSTVCVYGGVPISTQQRQLQRGIDIAVGTPGRIIDLIDRRSLHLQDVSFLVLDEADQMLAVGFEEDVERILEQIPQERQSMLFSATMPSWVKKLSRKYLKDPLTIDLVGESDEKLAEGIKMLAVSMAPSAKRIVLSDLIAVYARGGKSIVFTQTKRDADDVALALGRTVGCEALHGDITQSQREKTLNSFREGRFSVLVATDVAARGLDIPNVDLVIHYEIPNDSETFVHRSGRTGRAGKAGTAILMHSNQQLRTMRTIENDVGCKFETIGAPHMEEVLHASSVAATALVKQVHPDVAQIFLPTAEMLLAKEGTSALAAALAHLSGFSQLPAPRSLITHEEGWTTLRLIRNDALPRSVSPRMVMGVLSDIWQSAADNVGKIRVIDDPKVQGAVFDLPVSTAKELLTMPTTSGDVIEEIKKLPRLAEDDIMRGRGGDMYGRFSSRGAGRSSGAGRGSFDRGGRGGSRGGEWSRDRPRSSSFSDDRFSSGLRSERGERRGPFSGVCFLCNQPGHRAADCPSKH